MENEEKQAEETVGKMRKRREAMADGRRYIIFYTFGNEESQPPLPQSEVSENV